VIAIIYDMTNFTIEPLEPEQKRESAPMEA